MRIRSNIVRLVAFACVAAMLAVSVLAALHHHDRPDDCHACLIVKIFLTAVVLLSAALFAIAQTRQPQALRSIVLPRSPYRRGLGERAPPR
ncbi:hypothetical protein K8I61_06200 [bacterium]|nr:hypothetical protein [bacterium]